MNFSKKLDEKDIQILAALQADGRIPNVDLAKKIELSPPSTLDRIRRLENLGIIRKYSAVLDSDKLGFKLMALTFISLSLHQEQPIERFRTAVKDMPEVLECLHISGEFDFLLKIVVKDMKAYELYVREKLTKIKGIAKIQTSFVLGVTKDTSELPFASL